jgi:hypothetical protein
MLIGGVFTIVLGYAIRQSVLTEWRSYLLLLSVVLLAVVACIGAIILFRERIARVVFRRANVTLTAVAGAAVDAADHALSGNRQEALSAIRRAVESAMATYAWWSMRTWVVSIIFALSATYVGGIGTILLMEQNNRIQEQTNTMVTQREFAELEFLLREGDRRSAMVGLLSETITQIRGLRARPWSTTFFIGENPGPELDQGDEALVKNAVSAMQPYWYFDVFYEEARLQNRTLPDGGNTRPVPESASRVIFLSPERGLILQALLESGVSLDSSALNVGDESNAYPLGRLSLADARGLSLRPIFPAAVLDAKPSLKEFVDINLCGDHHEDDYRSILPGVSPDVVPRADLSGASLYNIWMRGTTNLVLHGASFMESILTVADQDAVDRLSTVGRTYGVQFYSTLDLLPQLRPYLSEAAALQGDTPHSGNCFALDRDDVATALSVSGRELDANRAGLVALLASRLGYSVSEFSERFTVQIGMFIVMVKRRDYAFG